MEVEFKKFCTKVRNSRVGAQRWTRYSDDIRQGVVDWAACMSVGAVARESGVSKACIYRWLEDFPASSTQVAESVEVDDGPVVNVTRISVEAPVPKSFAAQTPPYLARLVRGALVIEFFDMVRSRTVNRTVILARPLLVAERHEIETRRCLSCNTTAKADSPPELEQIIGRYAPSAVAALAGLRYMFGMPSLRMELLCGTMGLRVPDSTQWYLFEEAASRLRPFRIHLENVVANAPVKHFDDTGVTILSLREGIREKQELALAQGKNPDSVRRGLHTSVTCAVLPELGRIVLFNSGLHHCGEIVGRLLEKRTVTETVILIADAASANTSRLPKDAPFEIINANCNSHAVRKFKDLRESFPEPTAFFEQAYAQIFRTDAIAREKDLSAPERLALHREHSRPLMDGMKARVLNDFENRIVEPNSTLGKTYKYFLNHFDKLVVFCEHEGAPVCNNLAERIARRPRSSHSSVNARRACFLRTTSVPLSPTSSRRCSSQRT